MLSRTLFGRDSDSLRPSDGAAALGRQIDQRVALLSQLADGHSASLPDEASHRVQLCWSDEDELPSVVNHTCRKHIRVSESGSSFTFNSPLGNNACMERCIPDGGVYR